MMIVSIRQLLSPIRIIIVLIFVYLNLFWKEFLFRSSDETIPTTYLLDVTKHHMIGNFKQNNNNNNALLQQRSRQKKVHALQQNQKLIQSKEGDDNDDDDDDDSNFNNKQKQTKKSPLRQKQKKQQQSKEEDKEEEEDDDDYFNLDESNNNATKAATINTSMRNNNNNSNNKKPETIIIRTNENNINNNTKERHHHNDENDDNNVVETYNLINLPNIKQNSSYAYAFLVGSVDPIHSPGYKGFMYNIYVATRILRYVHKSTADIIVLIQISSKSIHDTLPDSDIRVLHGMGIRIKYIPKQTSSDNTFYDTVLEKFRILQLIEYDRILFLDADVMPLNKFDYLFDSSVKGQIGNNFLYATQGEPCNAGFFMLTPGIGKYEQLQNIINQREISVLEKILLLKENNNKEKEVNITINNVQKLYKGILFDEKIGWGIELKDKWYGTKKSKNKWNFWYAAADQGLLFYWTMYIEQNVTQIRESGKFITYTTNNNTNNNTTALSTDDNNNNKYPIIKEILINPFDKYGENLWSCKKEIDNKWNKTDGCYEPLRNFQHFWGNAKPWLKVLPSNAFRNNPSRNRYNIFFHHLDKINDEYNLKLNMNNWTIEKIKMGLLVEKENNNNKDSNNKADKSTPLGSVNDIDNFWYSLYKRIVIRRKSYLLKQKKIKLNQ